VLQLVAQPDPALGLHERSGEFADELNEAGRLLHPTLVYFFHKQLVLSDQGKRLETPPLDAE
jgi:hypothetical protein